MYYVEIKQIEEVCKKYDIVEDHIIAFFKASGFQRTESKDKYIFIPDIDSFDEQFSTWADDIFIFKHLKLELTSAINNISNSYIKKKLDKCESVIKELMPTVFLLDKDTDIKILFMYCPMKYFVKEYTEMFDKNKFENNFLNMAKEYDKGNFGERMLNFVYDIIQDGSNIVEACNKYGLIK